MMKTPDFPSPDTRIEMIEQSLRCFRLGAASLMPLIGAPIAIPLMFTEPEHHSAARLIGIFFAVVISILALTLALITSRSYFKARAAAKGFWNPGKRYRVAGEVMTSIAVLLSLLLLLLGAAVYVGA
jgi:hypothetical protein